MKRGLETSAGFSALVIPTASAVSLSQIVRFLRIVAGLILAATAPGIDLTGGMTNSN
jgi:hypothetical protein